MNEQSFEVVYTAQTALDSSIAQALLKDAGIPVVARPAGEAWRRIDFGEAAVPVAELLVPADRADTARSLLTEYQQQVEAGAFALEDKDEDEEE